MSYESRSDVNLYRANKLESTFVEIINCKKVTLLLDFFIKVLLWILLSLRNFSSWQTVQKNKHVFLLGDFNIDLLSFNDHQLTNEFLHSLASNSFIPYILQPNRLTTHSKTLIDNIFSNLISHEAIPGNVTGAIFGHLPQYLFVPNVLWNPLCQKSNIYERDWSKFVHQNFPFDYTDKDSSDVLQFDQQDVNLSIISCLDNMNSILDELAPLKVVNKFEWKFKSKP